MADPAAPGRMLREALAAQSGGRLPEAKAICQRLITVAPACVDAWHLLGVVELQSANPAAALAALNRAIVLAPSQGGLHALRARIHEALSESDKALADCLRSLELDPGNAESWLRKARLLRGKGDSAGAIPAFDRYLAIRPEDARIWFNRGNALVAAGHLREAVESYRNAVRLQPDFADGWFNLGTALLSNDRGEEAVAVFQAMLQRHPEHAEARINLGNALRSQGREREAEAVYRQALQIAPARAEIHNNLASILLASGQPDAALTHFDAALKTAPDEMLFHLGRATALKHLGQLDSALCAFDRALELAPDHVETRTSRSLCLLLAGRLSEGFSEYEWRWQAPDLADIRPDFVQPCWLGREELRGKRLLVRWEQGFGDTIQFSRYIERLNELGAEVILQVQAPLLALMRGLRGHGALLADNQPLPEFDYHVPMLSLPLALQTTLASIPAHDRYLWPDAAKVAVWRQRLGAPRSLRVGLAWSGRPQHKNDRQRSLPLHEFLEGLPEGPEYFVLQKDVRETDMEVLAAHEALRCPASEFVDFSDTAAVCELMDLVVTVDTSIAHLAGALGKPFFLLLPFVPDWRWLTGRDDSPWYPTARLFRQEAEREWAPVLAAVRAEVSKSILAQCNDGK